MFINLRRELLLEVRCCCVPERLLGYLPYPALFGDTPAHGQRIMFPVQGQGELRRLVLPIETIELPIETVERTALVPLYGTEVFELTQVSRLAYKSDETPIETLRRVPLWIEAPAPLLRFQSTRGEEVMVLAPGEEARAKALLATQGAYVCPHCGAVSMNAHDLREQYCGRCHTFEAL